MTMAFALLEQHVASLGGIAGLDSRAPQLLEHAQLDELSALLGAPLPASIRWWWSRFGCDIDFVQPVVYPDPYANEDTLLGWFLSAEEVRKTLDDYHGSLAPHRVPIINDGGDNFVVVDSDGSVYEHIHDAPLDRNTYRIADSFEQFVLSWRRGD